MEIVGKIKKIMDVQNVSDKFKKREFVLSTDLNTPYPQHIMFQTTQEKCAILDNLKANDEVKVFFNIRGREWTSPQDGQIKYFVTLEAWRIDKLMKANVDDDEGEGEVEGEFDKLLNAIESEYEVPQQTGSQQVDVSSDKQNDDVNQSDDDGLPF